MTKTSIEPVGPKTSHKGAKSATVFLQEIFIYYFVISIAGHYFEKLWSYIYLFFAGGKLWHPSRITFIPSEPPYGLGAVAIIILIIPLIKKYKLNPLIVFVLNIFVTGAVEYLCALLLIVFTGHVGYWDYSHQFMNINGYVCLQSATLFSLIATFFVYCIYPFFKKLLEKLQDKRRQFNLLFWVLFLFYIVELAAIYVRGRIF
jgi:uncharacterized membrane protein